LRAPAADTAELLIYDTRDTAIPVGVVPMTRDGAGDWSVRIRGPGVGPGTFYMYRLNGHGTATANAPFGTVLNDNFALNDPYAYLTEEVDYSQFYLSPPLVDTQHSIYAGGGKSIVYDLGADPAPNHVDVRPEDLIVYELHVQDYTAQLQGLPPALRGTYLGLAQGELKTPGGLTAGIDHLAELGVTAVELMPVMQYDKETTTAAGRVNHWGYMTTNFFAPETRYASHPGVEIIELKRLVQAFHDRGIAVFMDAVYNHTAEGDWIQDGRLAAKCYNLCDDVPEIYRGTGNGFFANASGTGNDIDFFGRRPFHQAPGPRFPGCLAQCLWHRRVSLRPRPHIGRWFDGCRRLGQCRPALCPRAPPRRAVGPRGAVVGLHGQPALGLAEQPLGQVDRQVPRRSPAVLQKRSA
jgi:glycogen operon protein